MIQKISFFFLALPTLLFAQNGTWQQAVDYTIDLTIQEDLHRAKGVEKLIYTNESPDTLKELYFHLYWNAFQRGSHYFDKKGSYFNETLSNEDFGKIEIVSIKVDGVPLTINIFESIGQVKLPKYLPPKCNTNITIEFSSQIPSCIERAGKNNTSGTDYTFTQWYPKICRYDHMGWHTDPYYGREFAGVFGTYNVSIACASDFVVAGTGNLTNKKYTAKGWADIEKSGKDNEQEKGITTWRFHAENVHDFAFAMDKEWLHKELQIDDIAFHFFYNKKYQDDWKALMEKWPKSYAICKEEFGIYPYDQFSFIQGGEGYMEYPNCTMLESSRSDFYNTACHEFMHNYFYGIFGTNENLHHWMDEGLTCYAEARISNVGKEKENYAETANKTYLSYASFVQEEPISTAANHFTGDYAYYIGAYFKGQLFPELIRYIIGDQNMRKGFESYYHKWKFKHPEPNDFVKSFEDQTLMELSWFQNYWLNTVQQIEFSIDTVQQKDSHVEILLSKNGIPMPVEIAVEYKSGKIAYYHVPLDLTNNVKSDFDRETTVLEKWSSASRDYTFILPNKKISEIKSILVDPDKFLPETNRKNNKWTYKKK